MTSITSWPWPWKRSPLLQHFILHRQADIQCAAHNYLWRHAQINRERTQGTKESVASAWQLLRWFSLQLYLLDLHRNLSYFTHLMNMACFILCISNWNYSDIQLDRQLEIANVWSTDSRRAQFPIEMKSKRWSQREGSVPSQHAYADSAC